MATTMADTAGMMYSIYDTSDIRYDSFVALDSKNVTATLLQRDGSADDDFIHGLVPPCVCDWSYYVDILMCVYFCIGYYGLESFCW